MKEGLTTELNYQRVNTIISYIINFYHRCSVSWEKCCLCPWNLHFWMHLL